MIKVTFILFVVGICTRQSLLVSGLNCTEPSAYNSSECVFECIKNLYDTEYCASCDVGSKVTKIVFSPNQTLTPLMQHDLIFYNDSIESIATGNCSSCMAEKTDQGFYERFKKPIVLVKFVNCTDGVNKTNCTTIEVKELYANITKRLEKEPWCVNALNLDGLFLKRLLAQPTISTTNETSNSSATGNGTESSATEQIVTSTEASATTGYVPSRENVEEEDRKPADEVQPKNNDSSESSETTVPLIVPAITVTSKPTSTTTADVTTHTTTSKPESTTKSKPTKKKKIVEDHHYHGSITIIAIIVGVLLTVLIVLAVVVRILIARRKNFHPRTSSTTYVFESHQY